MLHLFVQFASLPRLFFSFAFVTACMVLLYDSVDATKKLKLLYFSRKAEACGDVDSKE